MNDQRYDVRHNNPISTELADHYIINDCNFNEHFNVHVTKTYPESTDLFALKMDEDAYVCELLTSHPGGMNKITAKFYKIVYIL